jgi:hypothetical protein
MNVGEMTEESQDRTKIAARVLKEILKCVIHHQQVENWVEDENPGTLLTFIKSKQRWKKKKYIQNFFLVGKCFSVAQQFVAFCRFYYFSLKYALFGPVSA